MTDSRNKYCISAKKKFDKLLCEYTNSHSSIMAPQSTQDFLLRTDPKFSPLLQVFNFGSRSVNIQLLYPPESDCWGQQWQPETNAFHIINSQSDIEERTNISIIVGLTDEDFQVASEATVDWLLNKYSFDRLRKKYSRYST